jgi:hypothetical protein
MAKIDPARRRKHIAMLINALSNEAIEIRKLTRLKRLCYFTFIAGVAATVFFYNANGMPPIAAVTAAGIAGLAVGFMIYFENALLQWPTICEFLDKEALANAADEDT